jgi:hypothetical protein
MMVGGGGAGEDDG